MFSKGRIACSLRKELVRGGDTRLGLVSIFCVLGQICADREPLGHHLRAVGSFPAKYCSLARLNS